MRSSKWVVGLLAVVLVLALTPSSFAQVQIQIFNTPSSSEIQTNRNAQTSDPTSVGSGILVSGSIVATAPLTTTTLTLQFPAPITASGFNTSATGPAVPSSDPIEILGQSGVFASVSAVTTINYSAGSITITLPGFGTTPNTLSGTFRLVGVRIDANGKTAPSNVTASLSSSANNYIPPSSSTIPIINAYGAGIASIASGAISGGVSTGSFLIFTNQTTGTFTGSKASLVINEGFASAWRTAVQSSVTGTGTVQSSQIRVTVSGLPSGVTATITTTATKGTAFTLTSTSLKAPTSSATTQNQTVVDFTSTSLTTTEQIELDFTIAGSASGLTPGTITATATMYPLGAGLDSGGIPLGPGGSSNPGYPSFNEADVGPVTIGNILSANTTMLIPYAVKTGPYDTGIAIANTTMDPFAASGGGATASAGTITVYLFPRTNTGAGSSVTLTTSATVRPGVGLATDGTLAAGGVWTALMSDILTAAGQTGDFFGYLFIQTNFLDGHGAAYIFNGAGFTSSTPVLVLPPPSTSSSRNGGATGVESLNN